MTMLLFCCCDSVCPWSQPVLIRARGNGDVIFSASRVIVSVPFSDHLQNNLGRVAVSLSPRLGFHDPHHLGGHDHHVTAGQRQENTGGRAEGEDSGQDRPGGRDDRAEHVSAVVSGSGRADHQHQRGPGSGSSCNHHQRGG